MDKHLGWLFAALALGACGGSSSGTDGGGTAGQVKFTIGNLTGGWGGKSTYQQTSSVLITMDHVTGNVAFVGPPKTVTLRQVSAGPSEASASLTVDAHFNQHPCHYTDASGGQNCTALEGSLPTAALYFAFSVPEWTPDATVSATMNGASPMAFTACKGAVGGPLEQAHPLDMVPLSLFLDGKPFVLTFSGNHQSSQDTKVYDEDWNYTLDVTPVQ
jgi:hypothetical protein